jgi:chromosome segregation ATPase
MDEKEDLDSTRYKEHYQKLLDAVKGKFFYTVIHEAQECILYGKQNEIGRFT